ncbi:selenocysteine-specific elongation factor [Neocloeon triangulifer]|uniref:selenocysteine-specific elongation factor n=1 Tax=Neocloeon triangulifer TaxID=2078957 RepID=UPI00286ECDFC|nr:selenocysteine-specific elongation factor [Neocloeon triangulifer]
MSSILNINIGVLGHVDSGKTSLAKALSTTASTACFDKNPQSKERGITIDLGFSSFQVDMPERLKSETNCSTLQFTLVDCPGHASLIRTIIGGSQIIDMFILVLDVTKGMQTQTAECLVIGEITCNKMIVVLNKSDLLPVEKKQATIEKMTKKMKATLQNTVFKNAEVVAVSANPGGQETDSPKPHGLQSLVDCLCNNAYVPERSESLPFVFSVDHCFGIKGQGTVMTGTVLQGVVKINDVVEIPAIKETRKVKSMQMFRRPVEKAAQGDRLGICVTQFDPKLLERGLVSVPNFIPTIYAAVVSLNKIRFFHGSIKTKSKYHMSIGHETVLGKVTLFKGSQPFDLKNEFEYVEEIESEEKESELAGPSYFALIEFEKSVTAIPDSLVIASKLDMDIHTSTCRLAFWGKLILNLEDKSYSTNELPKLKIYKNKSKRGIVERSPNNSSVIVKNMFKKETNLQLFANMRVKLSSGEDGVIESGFGQSGKVKINIPGGLLEKTLEILAAKKESTSSTKPVEVILNFKKYIYDSSKKMIQK